MPNITAPVADIFPNDVDPANGNAKYKEGRTVFLFKKLTVDRDFEKTWDSGDYVYGLKFREDPEGSIWNIDGEYDKKQNKYLDYAGDHYQAGQIVNVQLVHEEYISKRTGTQGESRKIWGISLSDESPAELATPAAPVARSYDQNRPAALGMTGNMLVAIANAGNTEKIGVTPESGWAIIKQLMISNLEDRPLDEALSTLHSLLVPVVAEESPMVEAAVEAGAVVEDVVDLKW
jgi:ribosomal protein L12E/L44/L45/RPP1/RPP2